ncbi:MAG: alpha/beta fold hydrolase [Woeseiaceae bacterium]
MPELDVNSVSIAYETHGDASHPAIMLIQGLGMPLIAWPPQFIDHLTAAGFFVITMDNRDIGMSTTFHDAGTPNLAWHWFKSKVGLRSRPLYSLKDMAQDVASLLSRLGIQHAHIVGVSMGGMIGQRFTIEHAERCLSFTSIMSTTGNPRLPKPAPEVIRKLIQRPKSEDIEDRLAHSMAMGQIISSPGFDVDFDYLEQRLRAMYARGMTRGGIARQMLAIGSDGNRAPELRKVKVPTLVIHGKEDPLIPVSGGVDTAEAMPNARLELIDGMGHDLPPGLHERLATLIIEHARSSDSSVAAA